MERESINFVREILPEGRTVFYDFPDRYAFLLLEAYAREEGTSVANLKKSQFKSLLQKPSVKEFLSRFGDAYVRSSDFEEVWPDEIQPFRLTLGTWPALTRKPTQRWHQVTRWGWNLVLQLNTSVSHRRDLASIVPTWERLIPYPYHPIAENGELTLAWARIDIDLETGEALIEEIQSDWVRDVKRNASYTYEEESKGWTEYMDTFLKPYARKWPETMLTAAIWFLLKEIGIRTIFYHTFETGVRFKKIVYSLPPKSLYTDLPKKFCFRITHNGPLFIRNSMRRERRNLFRDPETTWYILDFVDYE